MKYSCLTFLRLLGVGVLLLSSVAFADYDKLGGIIAVDNEVPQPIYQQMVYDWAALTKLNFTDPDPEMMRIMHLQEASSDSLISWLTARIHYILNEKFVEQSSLVDLMTGLHYPPIASPSLDGDFGSYDTNQAPTVVTIASNVGEELFERSLSSEAFYAIDIPGVGRVPFRSPRTGLLKIGEGFVSTVRALKGLPDGSRARFAFRLSTLFHEARHSDGNGGTRAFMHAPCEDGDYQGYAACDKSLNGAYSVDLGFTKSFLRNCPTCTVPDQEALKALILDSASRVIRVVITQEDRDRRDDQVQDYMKQIALCDSSKQAHTPLPPQCVDEDDYKKRLEAIQNGTAPALGTPMIDWDDTPEKELTPDRAP